MQKHEDLQLYTIVYACKCTVDILDTESLMLHGTNYKAVLQ